MDPLSLRSYILPTIWSEYRTTHHPVSQPQVFTVTHPFHPLRGQTLEVLVVRNHWGADRVSYVGPDGRSRSLPIEWTDLASEDAFVTMARGRAPFRLADLLELRALVPRARRARGRAGRDK